MTTPTTHRRDFLKSSLAAAGAFTIAGTKASGRVLGANDAIRVGVAGLNGRGAAHVGAFSKMQDVRVTYLIDPDTRTFGKYTKALKLVGSEPACVQDVRRALDDKELDAISIAAPNHWHALMTVWGCQAGKDVYVEKPCSHNIHEGRVAVEAARKHGRIVQHGTQSRSSESWARTAELVKQGKYGKLLVSRGLCYKKRDSIGAKPNAPAPEEVDYNLWLGPAPTHEFNPNYVHYNWHWFWDFGNGDIGNQGVHQMDIARWMIPGATLPKSVVSLGGRFGYKDQGETPNTQVALMDYGDTLLVFEVRGLKTDGYYGQQVGNILHLEEGVIAGDKFHPGGQADKSEPLPKVEVARKPGGGDHFANFIAAVRSRKTDDLNADILEGHYSAALCHLPNLSYRLGQDVAFGSAAEALQDKALAEATERMTRHLEGENDLKLTGNEYRLGRSLAFDAKAEKFVDVPEADALLTRAYRAPFVVPAAIG